jgi:hypothetical protein
LKIGLVAACNVTAAGGIPVSQQQVVVNGQQQPPTAEQLTSPGSTGAEAGTLTATSTAGTGVLLGITPGTTTSASNKFVLTPEYIQHSEYSGVVNERKLQQVEEALVFACHSSNLAITLIRKQNPSYENCSPELPVQKSLCIEFLHCSGMLRFSQQWL